MACIYEDVLAYYQSLGDEAHHRLGRQRSTALGTGSAGVSWLKFDDGIIYCHDRTGPHVMYEAYVVAYWSKGAWGGVLGLPTSDPHHNELDELIQPGGPRSEVQLFEGGAILSHTEHGTWAVPNALLKGWQGAFLDECILGYPVKAFTGRDGVFAQRYSHGTIYSNADSGWAVDENGIVCPKKNYRLSLVDITCVEETDGLTSDDVRLSVAISTSNQQYARHRFKFDADTHHTEKINQELYSGLLPGTLVLSFLGVDADDESDASKALRKFEEGEASSGRELLEILEGPNSDDVLSTGGELAGLAAVAAGVIFVEAGAGGAVLVGGVSSGIGASVAVTGTAAALGLGVGAAVFLVALLVLAFLNWEPPDPIMYSRRWTSGGNFGILLSRDIAPPDIPSADVGFASLKVGSTYEREPSGALLEKIRCRSSDEDSTYVLAFRHELL